jgi:PAS domain S-box-containing protein
VTDPDGHFRLLNKAWEFALGYTRDELRAKPFMEFVHPDDRDKTVNIADRMQTGVNLVAFQNRYVGKDGQLVPLRWKGFVSTESGRFYTAAQDMRPTLAAREQQAALDALCELSREAVVMQSATGEILRWDGAAEELLGWTAEEVVGKPLAELLSLASGEAVDLLAVLDVERADVDFDDDDRARARFRRADGTDEDVLVSAREYGDGMTPVTGVVGLIALA